MILKQDASDNGWGRVMLWPDYHGGPNQKWKLEENQIVSHYEDLCLDLKRSRYLPRLHLYLLSWFTFYTAVCLLFTRDENGTSIGCYASTGGLNQQWCLEFLEKEEDDDDDGNT